MEREEYLRHLYIVVLCGGGGTRLWPRSRKNTPKQFINFTSEKTLYQEAINNAVQLVAKDKIIIITNRDYLDEVKRYSPQIPAKNVISEPEKKNTALAMGVAAAYVYHLDPKAVIVNIASDHMIGNKSLFQKTIKTAAMTAYQRKNIVAIGIKPTFPHTGLGYINVGKKLEEINDLSVYQALGFKEKPDSVTAEKFLKTGKYYWNANLYSWRASLILEMFRELAPDLAQNIDKILQAINTPKEKEALKEEYHKAREEQIDTAISEKAKNLLVIPGEFDWCDVGDWKVVYDIGKKGQLGNMVIQSHQAKREKNVFFIKSKNNLVHYDDQLIALIDVEGLVVVDTKDALLVCKREQAQDVKVLVNKLKELKKDKYL